jgi:murein L,D-transpeptidase YcbB/YkuD
MPRYIVLLLALVFCCCRNNPEKKATPAAPEAPGRAAAKTVEGETLIPRNTAIDSAHACNHLSLDTANLDLFISQQKLNDTLSRELLNFYNARNFQFAWFDREGLTEQAMAFSSLYQYSRDSSTGRKWLDRELDILQSDSGQQYTDIDPTLQRTEMLMTWRFMNFLHDRYPDKDKRRAAYLRLIPTQRQDPLEMAKAIVAQPADDHLNSAYRDLVGFLRQYLDWQQQGGWGRLPRTHRVYRPGDKAAFITDVKKRLRFTGEMAGSDTGRLFDKKLETAIKDFQSDHGLTPDGHIGPRVIKEMNVPVEARIRQLLVNLQRMQWLPAETNRQMIVVNIPDFRLQVLDGGHPVLAMNVIVGKQGHSTVLFSGKLNRIIFNPYWNIPSSIVKKEILPHMQKDTGYLRTNDMEITGQENGLPVIRQKPGDKNELGHIKFLFPNSFNIYLHDSPHKELFSRTRRAYSHGCIRVADARRLAEWLLRDMPDWSAEKIDDVIATGKERPVELKDPVDVLIVYYTAWVDEEKKLQFREDLYDHDSIAVEHLFLP